MAIKSAVSKASSNDATKKVAKKRAKRRSVLEDKTQISISLPVSVVGLIDEAAAEENRNRSNFIAKEMITILEEHGY